ncbi:phosphatase PAP2 family protein [Vagococcus zengguangii]|uniref:phosphatase PAP2 family protein n=1 Tax=Vagococcus zengguangii TaxID=2571750 RepID=UPI00143CD8FD|nr:phosphatase PAP2 family protein [Vagococcus zengguangii]
MLVVVGCIACLIFSVIVFLVMNHKTNQIDEAVMNFALDHRTRVWTLAMKFFTEVGKAMPVAFICLMNYFYFSKDLFFANELLICLGVGMLVAYLFKITIKRERPDEHRLVQEKDYSFPSYHALGSGLIYFSIILELLSRGASYHWLGLLICVIFLVMIGYSRVYLGIHYISDVLGGWSLGITLACFVRLIYRLSI